MTVRDPSKHEYSIVPIISGMHKWGQRQIVGSYTTEAAGEKRAVALAINMLRDNSEIERFHIYHSHPSPGPMDRYVGQIHPGDEKLRRVV